VYRRANCRRHCALFAPTRSKAVLTSLEDRRWTTGTALRR
jgi:hypothetical protein